jgi:hypothetical protein
MASNGGKPLFVNLDEVRIALPQGAGSGTELTFDQEHTIAVDQSWEELLASKTFKSTD